VFGTYFVNAFNTWSRDNSYAFVQRCASSSNMFVYTLTLDVWCILRSSFCHYATLLYDDVRRQYLLVFCFSVRSFSLLFTTGISNSNCSEGRM